MARWSSCWSARRSAKASSPRSLTLKTAPWSWYLTARSGWPSFTGGIAPYAALPGRVIAGLLKGQGIGLGVNLGVAPSSMLLPPEAMDWLAETLEETPEELEAAPDRFLPPSVPEAVVAALDAKLARAGGLALAAVLAGVVYRDKRQGHVLASLMRSKGPRRRLPARWARRWSFPVSKRASWMWYSFPQPRPRPRRWGGSACALTCRRRRRLQHPPRPGWTRRSRQGCGSLCPWPRASGGFTPPHPRGILVQKG
jgi:hypothetical protein